MNTVKFTFASGPAHHLPEFPDYLVTSSDIKVEPMLPTIRPEELVGIAALALSQLAVYIGSLDKAYESVQKTIEASINLEDHEESEFEESEISDSDEDEF